MTWLWLAKCFFMLFLSACSSDQVINSGKDKTNGAGSTNNNELPGKVVVICRCGKGHVSWSGENESSAKAVVKKNCESLSQSIQDCRVKK